MAEVTDVSVQSAITASVDDGRDRTVNPSSAPLELDPDKVEHRFADRLTSILDKIGKGEASVDEPAPGDDDVVVDTNNLRRADLTQAERASGSREQPDPDEAPEPARVTHVAAPAVPAPPAPVQQTQAELAAIHSLREAIRVKEEALVAREKALEPLAANRAKYEKMAEALELMQEHDALGALTALGMDPKEVIAAVAQGRGVAPGTKARNEVQAQLDAMKSKLQQAEDTARMADRQRQLEADRQLAYADITNEAKAHPILAALGDAGRDTVLVHMDQEYQRTGRVPAYSEAVQAVNEKWLGLLNTVLKHPEARKALLGSNDAGHPVTTPTIDAATSERTRTKQKKTSEMTPDERLDYVWRNRQRLTARS